jgi:hypothetical protein
MKMDLQIIGLKASASAVSTGKTDSKLKKKRAEKKAEKEKAEKK